MTAVKFTFDTNFDEGTLGDHQRDDANARKPYSVTEIETIRAEAYEQGQRAGEVRATESLAVATQQVAQAILEGTRTMDLEIERVRATAADLALDCARKIAGAALASAPVEEVIETLRTALHHAIGETHLTLRAAVPLAKALDARAAAVVAEEGYEGRIRFVGDPSLHDADCRIEWRGGGIERNTGQIEETIAEIIARRFPSQKKE